MCWSTQVLHERSSDGLHDGRIVRGWEEARGVFLVVVLGEVVGMEDFLVHHLHIQSYFRLTSVVAVIRSRAMDDCPS